MMSGRCSCGAVTYHLSSEPMFVHCCHCHDCQRLSGSAYLLNALIETDRVEVVGELTEVHLQTPSGGGKVVKRCAACGDAIFSHYLIRGRSIAFVRVGTLDDPATCPPNVQIFTESRQPWVPLSSDIPEFEAFYDFNELWPEESLQRRRKVVN